MTSVRHKVDDVLTKTRRVEKTTKWRRAWTGDIRRGRRTLCTIGAAGNEKLILSSQTYPSLESFLDALKSHLTSRRNVTCLVLSVARHANNC